MTSCRLAVYVFIFPINVVLIFSSIFWIWLIFVFRARPKHVVVSYISLLIVTSLCSWLYVYTGCPRRNVPEFGRVFLMLKYTDITQNTYIQSWTVTEIMVREKWGLLAVPNTAICTADISRDNASVLESECSVHCACVMLCAVSHVTSPQGFLMYNACSL